MRSHLCRLFPALLLSLAVGCGSGGGGPPANQNPPPAPSLTLTQVLQIVQGCGPENLDQFQALLEAFAPFFDLSAPLPPFVIGRPTATRSPSAST
ncbi:MAG: hypothetical protein HC813_00915 [Planctomycetes bacterium]|nr:hypothetical protein [Planctomycetota bacterium]